MILKKAMLKIIRLIKYCLLPWLLFYGFTNYFVPSENVNIRLYSHIKISSVQLSTINSNYTVLGDGRELGDFNTSTIIKISLKDDSIEVKNNDKIIGVFKYIKLSGDKYSELRLKLNNPERKPRTYQNNLSFSIIDGGIKIINEVVLDNYISGVTEAEAGSRSTVEFYKVQAILARTFALAHINRHITEGYNLCDQVHCQAYYGKPKDINIFSAIEQTKGKVVVDDNLNLITAAFHSNSGGQTANSEDVWGTKTSYLRSINDSFSVKMPNAKWERKMLTDDWLQYLKLKHNYPTEIETAKSIAVNFTQDKRKVFLECNTSKVPLKNVRQDLQLKSTFFTISQLNKDSIIFIGRGYGHGLGMCQEGAMRMTKLGYKYMDVLNFYYKNIQLIDVHQLSFFKDE
jgi:stage II sporulation protein D